jgi:pyochelin biosynthesis protein PchC
MLSNAARIDELSGSWLRRFHAGPRGALRLVCLPHAGGTAAAYSGWHNHVPDWVDVIAVQYPGREDRYTEPCVDTIAELAAGVAEELIRTGSEPIALFGHGMGALVAYEVAIVLQRRGRPVVHIAVSGQAAPSRYQPGSSLVSERGDEALAAELLRLGSVEPDLLADPEMRSLILPAARADYRAVETYRPSVAPVLECPLTSYYGLADRGVKEADAGCWYEVTYGRFHLRCWPGDHFYLRPREQPLVRDLATRLADMRPVAS